jgi:hypothetical protein
VAEGKASLKELKEKNRALLAEIKDSVETIAMEDGSFVATRDELRRVLASLPEEVDNEAEIVEAIARQEVALERQVNTLKQLSVRTRELQDTAAELEWEIAPLEQSVESLAASIETQRNAAIALSRTAENAGGEMGQLQGALEWYGRALAAVEAAFGVKTPVMTSKLGGSAMIDVFTGKREAIKVTFTMSPLAEGALASIACQDVPFAYDDIAAAAVKRNSMGFFVREVRARAAAFERRQAEIAALSSRQVVTQTDGAVTVVLNNGLVVKLALPSAYPEAPAHLVKADMVTGKPDTEAINAKTETCHTITDFVNALA